MIHPRYVWSFVETQDAWACKDKTGAENVRKLRTAKHASVNDSTGKSLFMYFTSQHLWLHPVGGFLLSDAFGTDAMAKVSKQTCTYGTSNILDSCERC